MTIASVQRQPLYLAPQPVNSETGQPIIRRVLIANRGEIACRVIATCRTLQIKSFVIYVQEDETSSHVHEADEAICLGSIENHTTNPFLNIELLVKTALEHEIDAIHPGYGYLSENADFATRVREAGIIFIGPGAVAMSTLGDKRSSKAYLATHAPDVPLIPGFSGSSTNESDLQKAAAEIGYPVMLKASAGGGGKGMRIVREASQLQEELSRVQSEASRSFGSSDCILEKYVESSKHIEIQIVGDQHGNVVSFFERDCSVQRRHQKVIEESPCTFLTPETRKKMSNTAIRIAKLIGYENAGTVEFVLDVSTSQYYFLEVNARLQVEHPITEEITGTDLVALQLFVAAGGNLSSLPSLQSLKQAGHAIECRLCAEDPYRDFFPEHGDVHLWRPADGVLGPGRNVRYETAVRTGSSVSIYFDSMIAKLVVWAPTRNLAIQKMANVLANTACIGVKTNQLFLQRCLLHPAFQDPQYTTSFIPINLQQLLERRVSRKDLDTELATTIIPSLFVRKISQRTGKDGSSRRPFDNVRSQFRNQRFDPVNKHCDIVTTEHPGQSANSEDKGQQSALCVWAPKTPLDSATSADKVEVTPLKHQPHIDKSQGEGDIVSAARAITNQYNEISGILRHQTSGSAITANVTILRWTAIPSSGTKDQQKSETATIEVSIEGKKFLAHCVLLKDQSDYVNQGQDLYCHFPSLGTWIKIRRDTLLSFIESRRKTVQAEASQGQAEITAPMPCKVLSILKKAGDDVDVGEAVMVIESMKMEVSIKANRKGSFETSWAVGDPVKEGQALCRVV